MNTNEIQCGCGCRFRVAEAGAYKGLLQCPDCGKALILSKSSLPKSPRTLGLTLLVLFGLLGAGLGGAGYYFRNTFFLDKQIKQPSRRSPIGPMAPRPGSMAEMAGGPGSVNETLLFPGNSGILAFQLGAMVKTKLFQNILEENRADLAEIRDQYGLDLVQIERMHVVLLAEEFLQQSAFYWRAAGDFRDENTAQTVPAGLLERQIRTGPSPDRNRSKPGVTASNPLRQELPDFVVIVLTFNQAQNWAQSTPRGMRKVSAVANTPGTTFDMGNGTRLHLCPGEKTALIGGITGLEKFMYQDAGGPERDPIARAKRLLANPENHIIFESSAELVARAFPGYSNRLPPLFQQLNTFLENMRELSGVAKAGDNLDFHFEARYPDLASAEKAIREAKNFVGTVTKSQGRSVLAFANNGKAEVVQPLLAELVAQLQPAQKDLSIVQSLTLSGAKLKTAMAGAFKIKSQLAREPNQPRAQPQVTSD